MTDWSVLGSFGDLGINIIVEINIFAVLWDC